MQCRVYKKEDSGVIYEYIHDKDNDISKVKIPHSCAGLPYIVLDESELLESNSNNGDYHEMLFFEGDCKKENLKQDRSWSLRLMPLGLIKEKHANRCKLKIKEEIGKEDSVLNIKKIFQLIMEKEECFNWSDIDTYKKALDNLDVRVHFGEADKSIIRKKLNQKILDLELKEK